MRSSNRARRRLIAVVVALGVVVCGISAWRIARKVQLRRLIAESYVEGMTAYREGDYATALTSLRYYVRRNRGDLEALLAFAEARSQIPEVNQRHLTDAISLYRAALKLDPENEKALTQLLVLYHQTGRRPERLEIADRLLLLNSRDVEALLAKSLGLFHQGRLDDALSHLERLIEIEPNSMKWRAIHLEIDRAQGTPHDQLMALCDKWIDEYQGDGRFHLLKVVVLLTDGLTEEAREQARLAAQRGAGSIEVLQNMLDLLDQLQLTQEAKRIIEAARVSFPAERQVTAIIIRRHWQVGQIDEAMAELDRHDPDELWIDLVRWKALLLIASNDHEGSEQALTSVVDLAQGLDPTERNATLAWVDALRANQRLDEATWREAVRACQRAIALKPQDPVLHHTLGRAHAYVGEHELAVRSFERAIDLGRRWVVPRLALGRSLLATGRSQQALAVAVELLRQGRDAPLEAYLVFAAAWLAAAPQDATVLAAQGTARPIDLVALLEAAYEKTGQAPLIAVMLVDAYAATGRREAAIELIDALGTRPGVTGTALLVLADASARNGFGLEQSLVERALQIAGPTPEVVAVQSELLRRQGRIEEGLDLIDSLLRDGSGAVGFAARRVRAAYLARARLPGALPALAELLETQPASLGIATMVLAEPIAWEDQALIARAIDSLGGIVGEQTPQVCLARASYVIEFESDDAAKLAQATALVGGVLGRTPDSLPALTLMSRLLLAGDAPDEELAIRQLRRAADLYPGRPEVYPRLIALLQQHGDYELAAEYLQQFGEHPDLSAHLQQVEIGLLAAQGDFGRAVVRLSATIDESSPVSEQLALASLQMRAGDVEGAEATCARLLAAADRTETIIELASRFFASVGRMDEALALLDAPELSATPGSRALLLGRLHQQHGDLDEATRWLQEAVRAAPDRVEPWTELARHWLRLGEMEQARLVAVSGWKLHPDDTVLRTILAMVSLTNGESLPIEAEQLLGNLGAGNEAVQAMVSLYARAADENGNLRPTVQDLAESRELVKEFALFRPAWYLALRMHAAAGRVDEGLRIARDTVNRFPGDPEPAQWAVELMIQQGRLDEALRMAETWRLRSLDDPLAADTVLASLLVDLHRPVDAVRQLAPHEDRILAAPDRLLDNLAVWVGALLLDRQFERAALIVLPMMSEDESWQMRWLALAATADVDVTVKSLVLAEPYLAAKPLGALNLANYWLRLAGRSGDASHYQRAEEYALSACEQADLTIPSWHVRASIATVRNDLAATELLYRQILAQDPRDLMALNNLACALVQLGEGCEEAAAFSARALALDPQNPHVLDTHARALACAGDLVQAERAARLALSKRSDDPGMRLTLVRILIADSRFAAAKNELDRVEALLRRAGQLGSSAWTDLTALRVRLHQQR